MEGGFLDKCLGSGAEWRWLIERHGLARLKAHAQCV